MALSNEVIKKADKLYNQYMKNKSALIKRYGAEAPKVMRGRAIKLAKSMVEKEQKQKIKEMIKSALTKGPVEEINSAEFVQTRKPIKDKEKNPIDVIKLDVPLLIRLLEYAKEDAQTDMNLHAVAENLITLSQNDRVLGMTDYDSIISPDLEIE
jgi:hypothetical protein